MLTPEQIVQRRTKLGASEVGAILGLDPYRTALDVWLEKRRTDTPEPEFNEAAMMGHLLEPVVAQRFQMAHPEVAQVVDGRTVVHADSLPDFGRWAAATPDRIALVPSEDRGHEFLVELKTRNTFTARAFGTPGTDEVPPEILAQVLWQQYVTGLRTDATVAVLVSGVRYFEYVVQFDADVADEMFGLARAWWERCIVRGEEPDLTGPSVKAYLGQKFKDVNAEVREAQDDEETLLARMAAARERIKEAEAEKEKLEQELMLRCGTARGIQGSVAKWLWVPIKGRRQTNWKAVAEAAGASADLIQQHTRIGEPYRQARFYITGESDE